MSVRMLPALAMLLAASLLLPGASAARAPVQPPTGEAAAIDRVARAFMEAGKKGDRAAMLALMTARAREKSEKNFTVTGGNETYTVGAPVISGETARVPVTLRGDGEVMNGHLRLRREMGEWRVFAAAMVLVPGQPELLFDFENPEALLEGLGEALKQGFENRWRCRPPRHPC